MARLFYPVIFAVALGAGTAWFLGDRARELVPRLLTAIEASAAASDAPPTWPTQGYSASFAVSPSPGASTATTTATAAPDRAAVPWPPGQQALAPPSFAQPAAAVPIVNGQAWVSDAPPGAFGAVQPAGAGAIDTNRSLFGAPPAFASAAADTVVYGASAGSSPAAQDYTSQAAPSYAGSRYPVAASNDAPPYAAAANAPSITPGTTTTAAATAPLVPVAPPRGEYSAAPASNGAAPVRDRYGYLVQTPGAGAPPAAEPAPTSPASYANLRADEADFALFEENTRVLARVGDDVIMAGDVLPIVNEMLAPYVGKAPARDLEMQRELLLRQAIGPLIETKLLAVEARRKIPAEALPKIEERMAEAFETDEMPKALARSKVNSRTELDAKLRSIGSSLERERRRYIEMTLARAWRSQQIDLDVEISHEEMIGYYQQHAAEYEHVGRVRWQQVIVYFSSYRSKDEAFQALARAGNQIIDGVPLDVVARSVSNGPTAAQGGAMDWTTQGSLVSKEVDAALFSLPVGALSAIIEDQRSFSIVRVVERVDAHRTSFQDAQASIREAIRRQKIDAQVKSYLAELRAKTTVWTAFDGANDAQLTARPDPSARIQ